VSRSTHHFKRRSVEEHLEKVDKTVTRIIGLVRAEGQAEERACAVAWLRSEGYEGLAEKLEREHHWVARRAEKAAP
jgi:hypothetical protein